MKEKRVHKCGCITILKDGFVKIPSICKLHNNNGKYIWLVCRHIYEIKEQHKINQTNKTNSITREVYKK